MGIFILSGLGVLFAALVFIGARRVLLKIEQSEPEQTGQASPAKPPAEED